MTKDQITADDILQVVEADDGAAIAIIHDRATLSFEVACSVHGNPYAFLYGRGATITDLDRTRDSVAHTAATHAAHRHTPRVATTGGQS